jgi:hypothetical protein
VPVPVSAAVEAIRDRLRRVGSLAALLHAILDVRERRDGLPERITLAADDGAAAALAEIVSTRAVRRVDRGKVRVDLDLAERVCRDQLGLGLDALLYVALEREPRDPAAEEAAQRAALVRGLEALGAAVRTPAARAFLAAELAVAARGVGDSRALAERASVDEAVAEAERIARCIDAALTLDEPVRVANFAARVLGDSKALARGSERVRRLGRALLCHHEPTRDAVFLGAGPISDRQALRLALEVSGVIRDEAALTVHCFGPLVYRKGDQRFDHVARHAALGEPVPLSQAQLRGAAVAELPVDRVLVIENQTPFLDYVDAVHAGGVARELVVLSNGQAGWAVVSLLRMVGRAGVPVAHTGDLDRAGVLIWRSLAARLFARVESIAMDAATHRRFRERGRAVSDAERERLRELVERDPPDAAGHDLLAAILASGIWIEQERFFAEAVLEATRHRRPE